MAQIPEPYRRAMFWRLIAWLALLVGWLAGSRTLLSEPVSVVLCTGPVTQSADLSDYYYCDRGLTLSAPPQSIPLLQLQELAREGSTYKIVAIRQDPPKPRTSGKLVR